MGINFVEGSLKECFGDQFPDAPIMVVNPESLGDAAIHVPRPTPGYYFNPSLLGDVLNYFQDIWSGETREALHLMGPTGSGKTSIIREVCARLGAPVMEVTGHEHLEVPALIYSKHAVEGTTVTTDGPLSAALEQGCVFVFNEIDLVEPGTLTGLNDVLESQRVVIEDDGRLVEGAGGFAFVATSNTTGGGDLSGSFAGTKILNLAFRDRFRKLLVGYPDPAAEEALLQQVFPAIDAGLTKKFVEVANMVRKAHEDASTGMEVTLSTRTLIRWVGLTARNAGQAAKGINPVHYALDRALAFGTTPSVSESLHQMTTQVFGAGPKVAP